MSAPSLRRRHCASSGRRPLAGSGDGRPAGARWQAAGRRVHVGMDRMSRRHAASRARHVSLCFQRACRTAVSPCARNLLPDDDEISISPGRRMRRGSPPACGVPAGVARQWSTAPCQFTPARVRLARPGHRQRPAAGTAVPRARRVRVVPLRGRRTDAGMRTCSGQVLRTSFLRRQPAWDAYRGPIPYNSIIGSCIARKELLLMHA